MAVKQFNSDLSPADLLDRLMVMREGSPDLSGYLEVQALISKILTETSASNLIPVNEASDLQNYLFGGEYVIPPGSGVLFVKDTTLAYPLRLPTAAPCSILGAIGGTGFVNLTYSGAGAFIRATGGFKGFTFQNLNFIQSGATAKLFDLQNGSNQSNWASFGFIWECFATGWTDLGLIEGVSLGLFKTFAMLGARTGLELRHWGSLGMNGIAWASGQNASGARVFELKNVIGRFACLGPNSFILGTNESVFKIDSAISTNGISIAWNNITGGLTGQVLFQSGGLNESSTGVLALNNSGQADSPLTIRPATLTDAAAPNNSVYYSSTQSKLVYKSSGGVVNVLY